MDPKVKIGYPSEDHGGWVDRVGMVIEFQGRDGDNLLTGDVIVTWTFGDEEREKIAPWEVKVEPVRWGGGQWSSCQDSAICLKNFSPDDPPIHFVIRTQKVKFIPGFLPSESSPQLRIPNILNNLQSFLVKIGGMPPYKNS